MPLCILCSLSTLPTLRNIMLLSCSCWFADFITSPRLGRRGDTIQEFQQWNRAFKKHVFVEKHQNHCVSKCLHLCKRKHLNTIRMRHTSLFLSLRYGILKQPWKAAIVQQSINLTVVINAWADMWHLGSFWCMVVVIYRWPRGFAGRARDSYIFHITRFYSTPLIEETHEISQSYDLLMHLNWEKHRSVTLVSCMNSGRWLKLIFALIRR